MDSAGGAEAPKAPSLNPPLGIYSKIISTASDEGPDEMMCFPAGLHYL